ncbi:hypothetical protein [Acinetobacter gyllenbergii]|uniref:hypothetical protein n=1 Tax=Acinetobacter gyllenbergii TaxID=134534 RepID=UPI000806AFF6|nr:hypothetical protein [Acinetobacter gyllenbergii]OBY75929.1 hypothetical protein NG55_04470 [Acinetobacter gyllenbergii]
MNNYKIKVNDEAESKEAQELFFELGFQWYKEDKGVFWETTSGFIFANGNTKILMGGVFMDADAYAPVTLPQLRDLVVLHRNDPKDGNYSLFISDSQGELNLYKTADDVFYVFSRQLKGWDKSRAVGINTEGLKAIPVTLEPVEQGLISGADALRALADGQLVQWMIGDVFQDVTDEWKIRAFSHPSFKFRLKPRTIKLELEIPAPFEPKVGEQYWFLSPRIECGYDWTRGIDDNQSLFISSFGCWRTEEEIKQVVTALRGIKG